MKNPHHCQHCGHDTKLVQALFNDIVVVDDNGEENYTGLDDNFDRTGIEICQKCNKDWTGLTK